MRITHKGRLFDIRHVASPDERREWLVCACEETTE
jgi:head-tail adaptor